MTVAKPKRLRKKETPLDVWKAHRKLRKKIASAKWYAKKKKVIVAHQQALQNELEAAHRERQRRRLWTTEQYMYWRCATEHALHDFPVRPNHIPPGDWLQMIDLTYAAMARMVDAHQDTSWYTKERKKVLKHLAIRELLQERQMQSAAMVVPDGRKKTPQPTTKGLWSRWTFGVVPSVCSTLGWILSGMVAAGIHATHWSWFSTALHTRFVTPHPHVWLDEDIQHLRRELDRLCTSQEVGTHTNIMHDIESIPSSLDSFLDDAYGNGTAWSIDSEQDTPNPESLPTDHTFFNPSDWIEWELDDILLHQPPPSTE